MPCFTLLSFTPVCFNAPYQFIPLLNLRSVAFGLYVLWLVVFFFIYLHLFSLPEYHLCFTPVCFNAPCQFMPLLNLRCRFRFICPLARCFLIYSFFFPYRNINFVLRLFALTLLASLHHCLICALLLSV
jgi:hypothetical protein